MNKIRIKGNLGKDPQVTSSKSGMMIARFSVADSRKKPGTDGRGRENRITQWWYVTCFKDLAEVAEQQLAKGTYVEVIGKLQQSEYTAKDGSQRTAYEVIADEISLPCRPISDGNDDTGGFSGMGQETSEDIPF